jgi:hypothetical protein
MDPGPKSFKGDGILRRVGDVIRNPVSFDRDTQSVTGIENSVPPSGTLGGVVFKEIDRVRGGRERY